MQSIELNFYSDFNGIQTHNHLAHKRTLNHLASLAEWLRVHLRTKWLWVRFTCSGKEFPDIQVITECRFTLNAYMT